MNLHSLNLKIADYLRVHGYGKVDIYECLTGSTLRSDDGYYWLGVDGLHFRRTAQAESKLVVPYR